MNYLSIEHLIVYAFLGITALVGSLGTTPKSFKEYATANKRFGTGALTMTILATWISGLTVIVIADDVYNSGLAGVLGGVLEIAIPLLIVLYFIAPKIVHFKDCMTAGDLMYLFYGESARIITGLLAFLYCISICAHQFMLLKFVVEYLGMNSVWGLFLGIGILALYTVRGGMRAVTVTDVLHFVVAFAVIPLLAHLMLHQAGGLRAVLSALSAEQMHLFSPEALRQNMGTKTITASLIVLFFPAWALSFPYIQRMLMAKHQQQSVGMYRGVLALFIPFSLSIGIIGLAGIALYPGTSQYVLLTAIEQLPLAGKGLVLVSLLGIILSTADSFLHVAGVSFVHDTLKPLATRWKIKLNELTAVKYTTFLIASAGFLLSLHPYFKIPFWFHLALRGIGLPFTVPMMAGVMGLKTDKKVFYVSTVITLVAYVVPLLFVQNDLATDIANAGSGLTSLFSYLGVHYYYHRGFEVINRSQYGQTTTIWHPSWQGARTALTSLVPTPQKLVRYFQQRITDNSSDTTTLALFVSVSYMVPLFMNSIGQPDAYEWLLVLRMVGAYSA